MTTSSVELFERLRRPFEPSDLEWRVMRSGKGDRGLWAIVTPYVDRAALINRLNQVCGLGGWQTETRIADGHVSVGVGIRVECPDPLLQLRESTLEVLEPAYEWVWRWDGTGNLEADPPHFSSADAGKGDFSMAFKRACEQFGIALYLREIGDLFAIFNSNGRYRSKIDGGWHKWDPPGLDGTPSYPGTIPDGGGAPPPAPRGSNGRTDEGREANEEPTPPDAESIRAQIQDAKNKVRSFMAEAHYRVYHLDALVSTHPKLKGRFSSAEQLGRTGGLEDWALVASLADKKKGSRWDEGPKVLAKEFPTGPERLQRLDQLLDTIQVPGPERIEIETAKRVGWNDGIEYWIAELEKR